MKDEISIFIIAVKSLEVHVQFITAWASLDTGDLIRIASKYLTCSTPPWQNHDWKPRKQAAASWGDIKPSKKPKR